MTVHPFYRAMRFVNKEGPNDCWNWTGHKIKRYGRIRLDKNTMQIAHRFIYLFLTGESGEDLVVDHLCRNRSCCNPRHLELVTNRENIRRGMSGVFFRNKTHCPSGHEYSAENVYLFKSSRGYAHRQCRQCGNERTKMRYHRKTQT